MTINTPQTAPRRRRFAPILIAVGVAAALLLALGTSGALSGFTASINNSANTIGSGTLLMSETQGGTTCLSSAAGTVTVANAGTCSTINKFGGATAIVPGGAVQTSTVTITNTGTAPANSFTLTPAGCNQVNNGTTNGTATDFCAKVNITVSDDTNTKCVYPAAAVACAATPTSAGNLTGLGTSAINLTAPLAPGASRNFTFKLQLDSTATNAYQGLAANEALLWSFAS
jgi:hypothetical protein